MIWSSSEGDGKEAIQLQISKPSQKLLEILGKVSSCLSPVMKMGKILDSVSGSCHYSSLQRYPELNTMSDSLQTFSKVPGYDDHNE